VRRGSPARPSLSKTARSPALADLRNARFLGQQEARPRSAAGGRLYPMRRLANQAPAFLPKKEPLPSHMTKNAGLVVQDFGLTPIKI
jgi:hypothetical protein